MKIRIKADVKDLLARGIPLDECAEPDRTACIKVSYRKGEGL